MPVQTKTIKADNPFTTAFVKDQIKFYRLKDYNKDGVVVTTKKPWGRLDDYMNVYFETGDYSCPMFMIDGRLWMSLTRMEIQSQVMPIAIAEGKVALLGLGMGFACLKMMAKPSVKEILVYELDPRVISFFKESFSRRRGFKKITFIEGDAREKFKDQEVDVCYADIYPTLYGDKIDSDCKLFQSNNKIKNYIYWGFERMLFEGQARELIDLYKVPVILRWFYSTWANTWVSGVKPRTKLSDMHQPSPLGNDFIVDMAEGVKLEGLRLEVL